MAQKRLLSDVEDAQLSVRSAKHGPPSSGKEQFGRESHLSRYTRTELCSEEAA